MDIIVGSTNRAKIGAVKAIFPNHSIIPIKAPSNVSSQPFSDEETRQGAINRAKQCLQIQKGDLGIGLEGGVMYIDEQLFLCNWGALVTDKGRIFTASGARIVLPDKIKQNLELGYELGDIMDDYASQKDVRQNEGAIGIFTNNLVTRKELFVHIVKLLRGQLEFWK